MPLFDKLAITTPAFDTLTRIPDVHTADGGNVAPTLTISGLPDGTVELAVIAHDPDAPLPHGFTHWTVYGIAPETTVVDASTGRQGPRSFGEGYFGPQPPAGHGRHHYYFWVYALSRRVDGAPTREQFLELYGDAVLEQARIVGTYEN
ncbi:YbhB/YbcL family Raf kinase inhibitor-like protein [Microbacterium sp. XT11]|uniref:YbhB/YbcL family Raf kinase inhibitor-like protein n=1 Tax=Microbacterium sp. XT11 TaxID=367477 RepID=UPI000742E830|nr:YbhB/YbcL family Raf kinase inhibitor-like protein [Microbacterium sp. XT11]ALX65895.1 PEBP family protein [Microbacterium sp. XT11]